MSWKDLIDDGEQLSLPWLGGRRVYANHRRWRVEGRLPPEHGWYTFDVSGGKQATWSGDESRPNRSHIENLRIVDGYVVGDWLVPQGEIPGKLYCKPKDLRTMTRVEACVTADDQYLFSRRSRSTPTDKAVYNAYCDRETLDRIKGVKPLLVGAFIWANEQREQRNVQIEAERERIEAELKANEMRENMGTSQGRRAISNDDFIAAAKSALEAGGADYLDSRDNLKAGEKIVRYRVDGERIECICDDKTLQIIDSGVCLTDHATNTDYDTLFTLESLPSVIREAQDIGKLVVWRHG